MEYLLAEIILPDNVSLTLGGIHRSPSANKAESTELLIDFIQKVCDRHPSHLLPDPKPSEDFLEVLSTCSLYQHVSEPTRFKQGVSPSLLDLVITNEEGMISELLY